MSSGIRVPMTTSWPPLLFLLLIAVAESLNILGSVLVVPSDSMPLRVRTYAKVLQQKLCARLLLAADDTCFPIVTAPAPANASSVITLSVKLSTVAEGYSITAAPRGLSVTGTDERGLLFGIGTLLQVADVSVTRTFSAPAVRVAYIAEASLPLASAPQYQLRMHQIGYRGLNNAYDAMSLPQMQQHITDLVLFGANAVEFTMANNMVSDPLDDNPLMPVDPPSWLVAMSEHADTIGINVSLWYPLELGNYSDPVVMARASAIWRAAFALLPRLDSIFVPGGDPGGHSPDMTLMAAATQYAILIEYHPTATMWISAQGFKLDDLDAFFQLISATSAASWLAGIVYGPW